MAAEFESVITPWWTSRSLRPPIATTRGAPISTATTASMRVKPFLLDIDTRARLLDVDATHRAGLVRESDLRPGSGCQRATRLEHRSVRNRHGHGLGIIDLSGSLRDIPAANGIRGWLHLVCLRTCVDGDTDALSLRD